MRKVLCLAALFGLITLLADAVQAQRPGGFFGRGGALGPGFLLMNKSVQVELKLSDEQKDKIASISKEYRAKQMELFGQLQDLSKEERKAKMKELLNDPKVKEAREAESKAIMAVLNSDQQKRFKQIELQQKGLAAFEDEQIAKELKLTDEQKEKIKAVTEDLGKDMAELKQEFTKENFAEMRKKMASLRHESMDKATAVLTADQKAKWKELAGEPFEMKFEPRAFNKQ